MATTNKKKDPLSDIKRKLPEAAPWVVLGINIIAAALSLLGHYKKKTDEAFMVPYTHVHYTDPIGKYICGDEYINKRHVCDGRFLNVKAVVPTLGTFLELGLTKEQWESTQKIIKQFDCGGTNEQGN